MHSFRMRYVVLGLLIYLQNAFCRTCGSKFDDIASKVVISDAVFEGRLDEIHTLDKTSGEYVYEFRPSEVFKGGDRLPKSRRNNDRYQAVPVGIFQGNCSAGLERKKKYLVFINATTVISPVSGQSFYRWTALPVKGSGKLKKEIKKTTNCRSKCAKEPKVRLSPNKASESYKEKSTIQLKCRVSGPSGSPLTTIEWFKDGKLLQPSKKYKFKNTKGKSSRLRIRKVSEKDSGNYSCKATNVNGFVESPILVTVYSGEEALPPVDTGPREPTVTPTPPPANLTAIPTTVTSTENPYPHTDLCTEQTYCLNGGTCLKFIETNQFFCRCPTGFIGVRCEMKDIYTKIIESIKTNDRRQFDRQMTILGLIVGVLVLLAVCIGGYCMAREKRRAYRKKVVERRRLQNLYSNGTHRPKLDTEGNADLIQPVTAAPTTSIELKHVFPSVFDASTQTDTKWYDHMSLPSTNGCPNQPLLSNHHNQSFPSGSDTLNSACILSTPELQAASNKPELDDIIVGNAGYKSQAHHPAMVNTAVVDLEPDQHSSHSSPNQSQNSRTESAHDGIPSKDPEFEGLGPIKPDNVQEDLLEMTDLLEKSRSSLEAALIEFDVQSDYDNQQSSDLEVNVESEVDSQVLDDLQMQTNERPRNEEDRLFVDSAGEDSDSDDSSAAEEQALFHKLKSRNSSVSSADHPHDADFPFGHTNGWQVSGVVNDESAGHSPHNYAFNPYASDEEQIGNNYFGNFGTPSCSRRGSQQQNELMGNDLIVKNPLLFDPDPDATPV